MKKKYIMPDVEMMKFVESEEIMSGSINNVPIEGIPGLGGYGGVTDDPFGGQN